MTKHNEFYDLVFPVTEFSKLGGAFMRIEVHGSVSFPLFLSVPLDGEHNRASVPVF